MGYLIHQREAYFGIKKENVKPAFNALKKMLIEDRHWPFVDLPTARKHRTLEAVLTTFRWEVQMKDGAVNYIQFDGEKAGGEDYLFEALAPFVDDGSFIEMQGEEGERWKYIFKGGKCTTKYSKTSYGDD